MNINDKVEVRLTQSGILCLIEYEENRQVDPKTGKIIMPLWRLMNIFGSKMIMGGEQLFKNNEIKVLSNDKPNTETNEEKCKNIGNLSIKLKLDTKEFDKEINKIKGQLLEVNDLIDNLGL